MQEIKTNILDNLKLDTALRFAKKNLNKAHMLRQKLYIMIFSIDSQRIRKPLTV